jgi:type II secretory pathway component PulC
MTRLPTWVLLTLMTASSALSQDAVNTNGADIGISIMGAIIQKNEADNVALIKESSGVVKAVKKDHVILEKYKVLAVTTKYIEVITRDAKRYFVYQDKFGVELASQKKDQTTAAAVSDVFREDGFERNKGKITMTAMYRDKLVKEDLAKVLMQATAEPFIENGAIVGFLLSQIDEGSIYQKAGCLDGDIITAINGQELNSVAGAIALLRSLKGADNVDVDVRRGGSSQKITVSVN